PCRLRERARRRAGLVGGDLNGARRGRSLLPGRLCALSCHRALERPPPRAPRDLARRGCPRRRGHRPPARRPTHDRRRPRTGGNGGRTPALRARPNLVGAPRNVSGPKATWTAFGTAATPPST